MCGSYKSANVNFISHIWSVARLVGELLFSLKVVQIITMLAKHLQLVLELQHLNATGTTKLSWLQNLKKQLEAFLSFNSSS